MPYYVFHLKKDSSAKVQEVTLLDQFQSYKGARILARSKRVELNVDQPGNVKIMFAEAEDIAEKKVREHRDAPILREWEK